MHRTYFANVDFIYTWKMMMTMMMFDMQMFKSPVIRSTVGVGHPRPVVTSCRFSCAFIRNCSSGCKSLALFAKVSRALHLYNLDKNKIPVKPFGCRMKPVIG